MGLRLAEGRFFDDSRVSADRANSSIVVNRKFINDFGWKEGLGKTVTLYDTTRLTVIGIIEDFYLYGVWQEVEPVMLRLSQTDQYQLLAVRAEPEDMAGVLEYIRYKWKKCRQISFLTGDFRMI